MYNVHVANNNRASKQINKRINKHTHTIPSHALHFLAYFISIPFNNMLLFYDDVIRLDFVTLMLYNALPRFSPYSAFSESPTLLSFQTLFNIGS